MQFNKYGITLRSLSVSDIERVRIWRNQEFVRLNMEYQRIVTEDDQKKWFSELDNSANHYFIFSYKNKDIGMVNLKNVNWNKLTAEAGIFIGTKEFINTYIPFVTTIILMEFAFEELKLNSLMAKIRILNKNAILFNERLGYTFREPINEEYAYYECLKDNFMLATHSLKRSLEKF